ncbi:hypothetical protein [Halpernia frigidisoli]|uniref:Lipoprotein n=1 Tax=Halpernia frigidisoli TaxID=1125876 RepID=A0A1I3ED68_9FLAO|nr:hypothetical protein [Halpernia frigidisoli]SFH96885.1 hypothetical protein SAMN05443292_1009 [Halpernia frigidisoli]
MKGYSIFITLLFLLITSCDKEKIKKSENDTDSIVKNDSAVINPMAHVMDAANVIQMQKFSILKNREFPVRDSAIVLKSVSELTKESAYLLFNNDQSKAELFLPNAVKSKVMERKGTEGNYVWTDGTYELFQWKGYTLRTVKDKNAIFNGDSM